MYATPRKQDLLVATEYSYADSIIQLQCIMKALKCKTLGGIHMQSTAAIELCTYIIYTSIYCVCAYECLAAPSRPSPVSRLFHAGCTSS